MQALTESQVHDHEHDHHGEYGHGHTHGAIDPSIIATDRGLWAVKWGFIGLMITAVLQVVVVVLSGSVALLADTIHNFGDASTAIPLGLAFLLAKRKPSAKFTYGLGRAEDLAGVMIVLIILFSAVVAGYQSVLRILHPQSVGYLWAVVAASVIGFLGNEAVAVFRIRVGKEIDSAALVADGYHARTDGWTSLAVLFGAVGVWLGFPLVDPIIGLLITLAILRIVWQSAALVFTRLLDGVDPKVIEKIQHTVGHVAGIDEVKEVRARWSGHRLYADVMVTVDPMLNVADVRYITNEIRHQLGHALPALQNVVIQFNG